MIQFGDQNLLVERCASQRHIEHYQSLANTLFFAPSSYFYPAVNYPPPPPVRVNQLYWPTGARRWSWFVGLADDKIKTAVEEAEAQARTDQQVLKLKLSDDVQPPMRLLPPRPVSGGTKDRLWLLPLVDIRYWWQFKETGDIEVTQGTTTWAGLIDSLEEYLDIELTQGELISAVDYLKPDPKTFKQKYANAAGLLDLAAHSTGRRLVANLDGTFKLESFTAAQDILVDNYDLKNRVAGNEFDESLGHAPESVVVSCPEIRHFVPSIDGTRYEYTESATDYGFETGEVTPGAKKRVQVAAYADFTTGGGSPDNDTNLDTLAGSIAYDYYASLAKNYDATYADIVNWQPNAYDDCVLWTSGAMRDEDEGWGGLATNTRAISCPSNLGVDVMAQQDGSLTIYDETIKQAKPDSTITAGSSGTFSVYEDGSDTGDNVTAYADWGEGGENVTSGKESWIRYFHDRKEWVYMGGECE